MGKFTGAVGGLDPASNRVLPFAGDQWIIKTNATLPNGKKLTATNIITRNGPLN